MEPVRRFAFPERTALCASSIDSAPARDEAEIDHEIARGYEEGLERGRAAAVEELRQAIGAAQAEGCEAGRREGFAAMQEIADALKTALVSLEQERAAFTADAEKFCVELALAALEKIARCDAVRSDFIERSIRAALKTLAPFAPVAILLDPQTADSMRAALPELPVRADEQIEAGQVRIDGGRLLVECTLDEALDQIRDAVLTVSAANQHRAMRPDQA